MSANGLFENININTYVPWRNQTKETVSVTIFDEEGLFLQESKIHPEIYIKQYILLFVYSEYFSY